EVPRSVAAGVDEEEKEPVELLVRKPLSLDLRVDQSARQIVPTPLAFLPGDLARVAEHLGAGGPLVVRAHHRGIAVHLFREEVEPPAVLERNSHEGGDDVRGKLARDVPYEVALTALDHLVDDLRGKLRD